MSFRMFVCGSFHSNCTHPRWVWILGITYAAEQFIFELRCDCKGNSTNMTEFPLKLSSAQFPTAGNSYLVLHPSSSSDLPLLYSVAFFSLPFYSLHKQSQWNKKEDRMECWFAANICTFPWDCWRKSGPWRTPCVTGTAIVSEDCFKRFRDSSWWLCRSSLYNVFFLNWVRCLSKAMQHIHVREITNGN